MEEKFPSFRFVSAALGANIGQTIFHQSVNNVSGSLYADHINIRSNSSEDFSVEVLNVMGVLDLVQKETIDLLKLDIEGAEYEIIKDLNSELAVRIGQIIVEFHHLDIGRFTLSDTKEAIRHLSDLGFSYFSFDDVNYLFYRKGSKC